MLRAARARLSTFLRARAGGSGGRADRGAGPAGHPGVDPADLPDAPDVPEAAGAATGPEPGAEHADAERVPAPSASPPPRQDAADPEEGGAPAPRTGPAAPGSRAGSSAPSGCPVFGEGPAGGVDPSPALTSGPGATAPWVSALRPLWDLVSVPMAMTRPVDGLTCLAAGAGPAAGVPVAGGAGVPAADLGRAVRGSSWKWLTGGAG